MNSARERLWVVGALGGVVVVIVLAVAIFQFGRKDPSPPSLNDNPNPAISGRIAFIAQDSCIVIAEASGERREDVYCQPQMDGVTWIDAGNVAFFSYAAMSRPAWVKVDLATRQTTYIGGEVSFKGQVLESVNGEYVSISDGDVHLSKDGTTEKIADFDTPDGYWPQFVTWSPDGEWILLSYIHPRDDYDEGELWIVRRDGSFKGTLATDVRNAGPQQVSWFMEGLGYLPEQPGLP